MTAYILLGLLIILIFASAFFSGSETGMMSLNRYRLRHMAKKKHRAASRVYQLLARTDRLLGVILIGNTFANIFATSIATVLAVHYFGDYAVVLVTVILTFVILIFAEITPKIVAANYPERIAFPVSLPLKVLLKLFYPLVWLSNMIANNFLRLLGIEVKQRGIEQLTREELRSIVSEASGKISSGYTHMLTSVLDLGGMEVDDIMVPRHEIVGIDINNSWENILLQLTRSEHTRLPVYRGDINHIQGILHLRKALNLLTKQELTKATLLAAVEEAYFIPECTALNIQLVNFRQQKTRMGLVVDEYGDILGLVTLEDILEEIVGEFTTDLITESKTIQLQDDNSYLVDGSVTVRDFNRTTNWKMPITGPNTVSGLIIEYLETIPKSTACLILAKHRIEIKQMKGNKVKRAQIWPIASD